jgi:hypothetical protein
LLEALAKKLVLDEVIIYLLLEEMRWKASKSTKEALVIHGRLKEKGKKREKGISKSHGRSKSPGNSKVRCWNYKVGHFKRDYKEEKRGEKKKRNDYDDEFEKYSQEDGGDSFCYDLGNPCMSKCMVDRL